MKRIFWLGLALTVALAGSGLAIAAKRDKGTTAVAFAFTGTAAADELKSRSCTGADGTYVKTKAVYTGAVTGLYSGTDAKLKLHTTVNTTKGLGVAAGSLHLRGDDSLEAKARLVGTVKGSTISGVLIGRDVRGEDRGKLIANFSATLGTGSISLNAGSGAAENDAVLYGGAGCEKQRLTGALGTVKTITSTSITVATSGGDVTCSLTAEQAARLGRLEAGDRVAIRCDADGKLVKISRRK